MTQDAIVIESGAEAGVIVYPPLSSPTIVLPQDAPAIILTPQGQPIVQTYLDSPPVIQVITPTITVAGGGGSGGGANLFVQQTNPGMTTPGMWWETRADGSLKTLWVESGV